MNNLYSGATCETGCIATDCESDETPVGPIATRQDLTRDGNSSKGTIAVSVTQWHGEPGVSYLPEAHYGVSSGVVTAIVLGFAELTNTHRGQTDVATACKAKERRVNNEQRQAASSR